jgi:uncharacterized damage-inducible protein DinB
MSDESRTMIHDDLASLYAYNRWADGRMVETLRRLSAEQFAKEPAPGWTSVRATVVHLADAPLIWSRRLAGEDVTTRRTEADLPNLDDAVKLLQEGHDTFDRFVADFTLERLASALSYRNFKREAVSLPIWAVLRHVANHATYHRGQVASKLRLLGFDPPMTDLLLWAVEQTPQPATPSN